MRSIPFSLALLLLGVVSCGGKADDTALPQGDADTDVDADSDGDSDSDADSDGDSDADADSDSDVDCDADGDADNNPVLLEEAASAVLYGAEEGDHAGSRLAAAGDVDGDGHDDVLVGCVKADGSDAVSIVYGPVTGARSLAEAEATIEGTSHMMYVPDSLSIVGDTNGDGFDDVVVGSYGSSYGDRWAALFLGPLSGSLAAEDAVASISSVADNEVGVSWAGDVDGSGTADFIVDDQQVWVMATPLAGALNAEDAALATLLPPIPSEEDPNYSTWHVYVEYEREGYSRGVGDLNGDGNADMVVTNDYWNGIWWELEPHDCCPPSTGILWVVSGPVSGTVSLEDHDPTLTGEETAADPLGGSPNPAGDTNGDGLDDFVVNGGAEDSYFLVLGPATSSGTIGEQDGAIRITGSEYLPLGTISGAGDIDGDGFTDLVGSFWTSGGTDWAYGAAVLMGPLAGTVLLDDDATLFREEIEDDLAGRPVAQGGDIDGDGLGDFLVSAYGAHHDGVRCGEVYLFYGADLLDPRTASSP